LLAVLRDDNLDLLTFSDPQNPWSQSRLSLERSRTETGLETSRRKAKIAGGLRASAGMTSLARRDQRGDRAGDPGPMEKQKASAP
jgi:hypothetical protein